MNWLQKLVGRANQRLNGAPSPTDDYWYHPVQSPSITGLNVSPEVAIRSTAVWACIQLISQTLSTLPIAVFRRTEGDSREKASDHPLNFVLSQQPNSEQTAAEFWSVQLQDMLRYGNGYARIRLGARAQVESLTRIHPCCVVIERDRDTGVKFYRVNSRKGEQSILFDDEMFHLPGVMADEDSLGGVSPLTAHRRQIELDFSADEMRLRLMANNAAPGGYLSHPSKLSDDAKKNIRESWSQIHGGIKNAGKFGVLEEGLEFKAVPAALSKDMESLASQKFTVEQIARIYGVPLHMINSLEHATFSNIEHQAIQAVMYTFRPLVERLEQRIMFHLLGPIEGRRFFVEMNMMGLLRGDSAARAAFFSSMRNIGVFNANEIRGFENLNPYEGGEIYMVQGAMIPVDMAGKMPEKQAVQK